MTLELKRKIGQMLMAGFPSPYADEQAKRLVNDFCLGNFVLFKRNFENSLQTGRMCEELNELTFANSGIGPIISLDQEGGTTTRMVEGACLLPGAMTVAAGQGDGYAVGSTAAKVLTAHGLNTDLAPVLDVNSQAMNPIIGARSFGDKAENVIKYGVAELRGMDENGLLATMTHFPGHGNVNTDSHLALPVCASSADELYNTDFATFKSAIDAGAQALMTCHVVFENIDKDNPATLSKRIMTGLLRDEFGFEGIAMTDCLEMHAISETIGTGEGAVRAVEAGCDIMCVSHTYEAVSAAANAIYRAVESGRISEERINESYERIIRVKRKFGLDKKFRFNAEEAQKLMNDPELIRPLRQINRESITRVYDEYTAPDLSDPVFISPYSFGSTGNDNPDGMPDNFALTAAKRLGGKAIVYPVAELDEKTLKALNETDGSAFILGLLNARFRPSQIEVYKILKQRNVPLTVVLLGAPYDLSLLNGEKNVLAAYEYTSASIDAVIEALKENSYRGVLPVRV